MKKQTEDRVSVSLLKKALVAIAFGVLSVTASAECYSTGCTAQVEQVYIEADGGLWVQTTGNEQLVSCTPNSGIYLRLEGNAPKFKEIYALLLSAQLADRVVNIRLETGSNPCRILYVSMSRQ